MSILCLCYQVLQWYSPIFVFLTHRVQLSHFDFAFCYICSQLRRNKDLGGWGFSHPSHSRTFTFSQRFINAQQIFGTICSRWIHAAVCHFRALRFDLKCNGTIDCIVHCFSPHYWVQGHRWWREWNFGTLRLQFGLRPNECFTLTAARRAEFAMTTVWSSFKAVSLGFYWLCALRI